MRHPFGLSMAALVLDSDSGTPVFAPGAPLTFWNALTDGVQYVDLSADSAGLSPMDPDAITASDGTDGYLPGQLSTIIYGPDGISGWWASADGGPRLWMDANDLATSVDTLGVDYTNVQSQADGLSQLTAMMLVVWRANPDGTWNPRPPLAGDRTVWWIGPSSPPIGGDPEYVRDGVDIYGDDAP